MSRHTLCHGIHYVTAYIMSRHTLCSIRMWFVSVLQVHVIRSVGASSGINQITMSVVWLNVRNTIECLLIKQ